MTGDVLPERHGRLGVGRAAARGLALLLPALLLPAVGACAAPDWTPAERATLRGLSLSSLPPLPPDPSNAVADKPEAAALGQRLFFDVRLSANNQISCAHCHQPALRFSDGLPLGKGLGQLTRHTPSLIGTAYSPWQFWDGRTDSQWSQALQPADALAEGQPIGEAQRRLVAVSAADLAVRRQAGVEEQPVAQRRGFRPVADGV